MIAKLKEEQDALIEAGRRLGVVLHEVSKIVAPGVSTEELDLLALKLIREGGDEPAFLDYTPEQALRPYPATLCVSINDEVVHGIPNEAPRILHEGDIVSLDLGLIHKGYVVDSALTVPVGMIDERTQKLLRITRESLENAIAAARPGNKVGDISHATEKTFKGSGFSVVKVLGGHGVGAAVHEEPWISNVGRPGTGPEIKEGMVLALEPIANLGGAAVTLSPDGYTYKTKDGSKSAHFEHTIIVLKDETLVVTRRPGEVA